MENRKTGAPCALISWGSARVCGAVRKTIYRARRRVRKSRVRGFDGLQSAVSAASFPHGFACRPAKPDKSAIGQAVALGLVNVIGARTGVGLGVLLAEPVQLPDYSGVGGVDHNGLVCCAPADQGFALIKGQARA